MNGSTMHDAALRYAAIGYPVFPCGDNKAPLTSRGFRDSSTDPEKIAAWWKRWPDAAIGIATAGLLVVDIDGEGNCWPADEDRRADLEAAPTSLTPSGGRHHIYRRPEGVAWALSQSRLAANVDTRTNGGYIIAPPSKITAGGYQWADGVDLVVRADELPSPPAWLHEALDRVHPPQAGRPLVAADDRDDGFDLPAGPADHAVAERASRYLDAMPEAVSGQAGHSKTYAAAAALVNGFGLDQGAALDLLWTRYNPRCQPRWSEKELRHKVRDAATKPHNNPRGYLRDADRPAHRAAPATAPAVAAPATKNSGGSSPRVSEPRDEVAARTWKPFPVDAMPLSVRDYVAQTADGMSCDPALVALPMLAGLAAAIGNTRTIMLSDEWQEPSILWMAVVADSGSLKTPASRKALRFITDAESEIEQRNATARDQYDQDLVVHESRLAAWKQQARRAGDNAGAPPAKPPKPIQEAYVVSDATIEAIVGILADNPRGLLLERDELSSWLGGFDRYKSGGSGRVSAEVGHWLSMHNAGTLRFNRKGTGRTFVERAALSITGGIQPDTLAQAIGQEHVANGLLARFLLAAPPRRMKRFTTTTADFAAVESARQLFATLYGTLRMPEDGPRPLPLSRDGLASWEVFFSRHATRQHEARGVEASMLGKIEAAAARLALIHHVCRQAGAEPTLPDAVDSQSVEVGVRLAEWFADEWLRVYEATVGGGRKVDQGDDLVAWVKDQGGEAAVHDIGQRLRRYRDTARREQAITGLVHAGRLESFSVRNEHGGPPAHWVRVRRSAPQTGGKT